jgi:hypothetical protein
MVLSNLPSAFDAVSVRLSGCAPFTGEITVGAVTFKVEPSAPALPAALSDTLGEVGVSEDFEQAIARASTAAAEQRTILFWCIGWNLDCCFGARWEEPELRE